MVELQALGRRDLEPRAGWAMGNAGIIRELLRYARLSEDRAAGYAVRGPITQSQATIVERHAVNLAI